MAVEPETAGIYQGGDGLEVESCRLAFCTQAAQARGIKGEGGGREGSVYGSRASGFQHFGFRVQGVCFGLVHVVVAMQV